MAGRPLPRGANQYVSDDRSRRFRLVGSTSRDGSRRTERANPAAAASELLAAVRAAALACAAPTLVPGDAIGPIASRNALTRLVVRDVHSSAFRLLGEAELALASWLGRVANVPFAVVLYDRAYNVVSFDRPVDLGLARRANEAAARSRFDIGHEDAMGHPPVICTLGVDGTISTVARPAFRDHRQAPSPWEGNPAAGSDEPSRSALYLVTDGPETPDA